MEIIFAIAGQFSEDSWVKIFIEQSFPFNFNHLALEILVIIKN